MVTFRRQAGGYAPQTPLYCSDWGKGYPRGRSWNHKNFQNISCHNTWNGPFLWFLVSKVKKHKNIHCHLSFVDSLSFIVIHCHSITLGFRLGCGQRAVRVGSLSPPETTAREEAEEVEEVSPFYCECCKMQLGSSWWSLRCDKHVQPLCAQRYCRWWVDVRFFELQDLGNFDSSWVLKVDTGAQSRTCTSAKALEQHLRGRRHLKKAHQLAGLPPPVKARKKKAKGPEVISKKCLSSNSSKKSFPILVTCGFWALKKRWVRGLIENMGACVPPSQLCLALLPLECFPPTALFWGHGTGWFGQRTSRNSLKQRMKIQIFHISVWWTYWHSVLPREERKSLQMRCGWWSRRGCETG